MFNLISRLSYFVNDFKPYLLLNFVAIFLGIFTFVKTVKSSLSEKSKKIILSGAFSLILIIVIFSFFEAYFRYIYDESDGLGFLKVNERWHKRHVVHNSNFFRDRDFTVEKKEGVTRIGVIGDSLAFGAGIKNVNNRFSNILEQKLKSAGKNVEVYNLGVPGLDTQSEIKVYNNVSYLNFDIIVWEYYLNDIQPEGQSTGSGIIVANSQTDKIVKSLSNFSFFFDFLYWRLSPKYKSTFEQLKNADLNQYSNQPVLQQHKKDIADFIASLKSENKKVVVVIFPFLNFLGPNYPAYDIHKMMSGYFSENGAQVIDLIDDLKNQDSKTLMASPFDSHPNEKVHALVGEKLYNLLSNQVN